MKSWMTNDILDLSNRRRSLKKTRKGDHLAMQNYSEVNQEVRRKMKQAKKTGLQTDVKKLILESEQETAAFNTLK